MLETITLRGTCGAFDPKQHFKQLNTPSLRQLLKQRKMLPLRDLLCAGRRALTFPVDSPLSGATVNAIAYVRRVDGQDLVFYELHIPVLAAISAQDVFSEGVAELPLQLECIRSLAALCLLKLGMRNDEIDRFQSSAMVCKAAFTWYCGPDAHQDTSPTPAAAMSPLTEVELLKLSVNANIDILGTAAGTQKLFVSQYLNPEHIDAVNNVSQKFNRRKRVTLELKELALRKIGVSQVDDLQPHVVLDALRTFESAFGRELARLDVRFPEQGASQVDSTMRAQLPNLLEILDLLHLAIDRLTKPVRLHACPNARAWCSNVALWAQMHQMTLIDEGPEFDIQPA